MSHQDIEQVRSLKRASHIKSYALYVAGMFVAIRRRRSIAVAAGGRCCQMDSCR